MNKKHLPYAAIPLIAALYLVLNFRSDDVLTLLRSLMLIGFGYAAAYSDYKTRKVPNKLILSMLAAWAAVMAIYVIMDIESALEVLIQSAISGAAAGILFLFIYFVSRKGIGGGDVKFITVMGLFLTFNRLMQILFFTSLFTVIASTILLLTKRATMKSAIPLLPFLYAGILIIIFFA